jgi:hypothetical protein
LSPCGRVPVVVVGTRPLLQQIRGLGARARSSARGDRCR